MLLLDCILKGIFTLSGNTWGTVSDWVMVLVTITTAILLLKTLESQKEVQRLQQKSFLIDNENIRESKMPRFMIKFQGTHIDQYGEIAQHNFEIKCEKNDCFDLKIDVFINGIYNNSIGVREDIIHNKHWVKNQGLLTSVDTKASEVDSTKHIKFDISFSDLIHNNYIQEIIFFKKEKGVTGYLSEPKYVIN